MSRIYYRAGYKYQLARDYEHKLPEAFSECFAATPFYTIQGGLLHVYKSYAWDGASGPTVDSQNSMRASLVHDVLYQAMRRETIPYELRDAADMELYRICLEDGMWKPRAWIWYKALKSFGGPNAEPGKTRPVLDAGSK